jgi:hypothetical protein
MRETHVLNEGINTAIPDYHPVFLYGLHHAAKAAAGLNLFGGLLGFYKLNRPAAHIERAQTAIKMIVIWTTRNDKPTVMICVAGCFSLIARRKYWLKLQCMRQWLGPSARRPTGVFL